ncbi:MAG: hypothetical protein MUD01_18950 [Chloroflexaceae bacterium]|nr:hypothetical protein [Chloroflexaceae bacterium]
MTTANVHDMVKQEVDTLPDVLAGEVLDFVFFLKARYAEEAFLWTKVEEAQQHRRQHPEEVQTVTAEEWEQLTEHLDRPDQ